MDCINMWYVHPELLREKHKFILSFVLQKKAD